MPDDLHVEMIFIGCRELDDESKRQCVKAGVHCADEHCWRTPDANLSVQAGSEDDGFIVNMPICEHHAEVLARVSRIQKQLGD